MKPYLPGLIGLIVLGWVPARVIDAQDEVPHQDTVVPAPLKVLDSVSFWERESVAWLPPVHCDDGGNVFFVVVPPAQPPAPGQPLRESIPTDILRIGADGKETTTLRLTAAPTLVGADTLRTLATALDAQGTLFVLVVAERGETIGQHIVSFDQEGRYRSTATIDWEELLVGSFEVFDSGDFLLQGFRENGEPRVTVMSPGGSLRDVFALSGYEATDDGAEPVRLSMKTARGGDGRVYLVSRAEDSIHAIEPSGGSRVVVELREREDFKVVDLKAAGEWLAVVYFEARRSGKASGRFWMDIYNPVLAELEATYGPVLSPPLCYQYERRHEFILLKDARYLVTVTP